MSEADNISKVGVAPDENIPLASDFMHYFPFACGQFQCGIDIRINKMVMSDFVGTVKSEKVQHKTVPMKTRLKTHLSRMTIASETDVVKTTDDDTFDQAIVITATCNLSDRLTNLKFHKSLYLSGKIIKILGLIIQFYPALVSITLQPCINNTIIYELSKLLTISHITEVCLDGCTVKDGNYELLLGDDTGIRILSLARNTLGDPMVCLIAERLMPPHHASTTLLMLNLTSNRLTDISAKALATALRVNRCLRNLNLSDNAITDQGAGDILDTMLEMMITESEVFSGREYRFNYLKEKMEVMNDLIKEITFEETEKYKRHITKQQRKKKPGAEVAAESEPMSLTQEMRNNIIARAAITTDTVLGKCIHPFYPITNKNGIVTCFGNNTLHSLNIAYNHISVLTVRKILNVMEYQKEMHRMPRGLLNVNIEGNNLPVTCPEFKKIDAFMVAFTDEKELYHSLSLVSPRKRLRTIAATSHP